MNCIPYFIFSEHTDNYYFNGEYIHSKKFKNCIKEINLSPRNTTVSLEFNPFTLQEITSDPEDSAEKFNDNYAYIEEVKRMNRIVLI